MVKVSPVSTAEIAETVAAMEKAYRDLLEYLMPPWDSSDIDVELRLAGVLGMQGVGKTTLAMTIANDLYEKRGDSFVCLYGYWLHKLLPRAIEQGVLKSKKHVLIVIDDATALLHISQSRKLLAKDYQFFWRLRHIMMSAGIATHTAKIALIINMHSYMTVTKYLRNAHVLIVKSLLPKWQRFEHEDVTLRWLDSAIAKELTRMRYSNNPSDIAASLNKGLAVYFTGMTRVIKYDAKKRWPPGTVMSTDTGAEVEVEETDGKKPRVSISQRQFIKLVKSLGIQAKTDKIRALHRILYNPSK